MDWEKAKNILIIVLIFLNAGLFAIIYFSGREKSLTEEEIKTITSVLKNNGIELACDIPTDNSPLRLINVVGESWDYSYIKGTLFSGDEDIIRTNESGNIVYKSGDKTVTIFNALTDKRPLTLKYEEKAARQGFAAAEAFKAKLGSKFKNFHLYRTILSDEKQTFLYNEVIKNKTVFCSVLEITITNDNLIATAKNYDAISYADGLNQLYGADEALLAFMRYALAEMPEGITIEGLTLGYNFDETSSAEIYKARLYYRVFIKGYTAPVYIDAVTNTVLGAL